MVRHQWESCFGSLSSEGRDDQGCVNSRTDKRGFGIDPSPRELSSGNRSGDERLHSRFASRSSRLPALNLTFNLHFETFHCLFHNGAGLGQIIGDEFKGGTPSRDLQDSVKPFPRMGKRIQGVCEESCCSFSATDWCRSGQRPDQDGRTRRTSRPDARETHWLRLARLLRAHEECG